MELNVSDVILRLVTAVGAGGVIGLTAMMERLGYGLSTTRTTTPHFFAIPTATRSSRHACCGLASALIGTMCWFATRDCGSRDATVSVVQPRKHVHLAMIGVVLRAIRPVPFP